MPAALSRRHFLAGAASAAATYHLPLAPSQGKPESPPPTVRIALISDLHQDIIHDATRRLEAFLAQAAKWEAHAVVELGDFCIPKPANREFADLFARFDGPSYHVIGNHDTDGGLSRDKVVDFHSMPSRYYSADLHGVHLVVLDANDRPADHAGGYPSHIADDQIAWLEEDLASTSLPTFIFSHQSLERPSCIRSQEKVRAVIEAATHATGSRKVAACLNGHWHIDHARTIADIPYIHINSASYYWVGAGFRRQRYSPEIHASHPHLASTAPYKDPLFTLLTIDFSTSTFSLSRAATEWVGPSPQEIGQAYPDMDPAWVSPSQSRREGQLPSP